ncbi:MAG: SDR family oxidoreductase [Candidatus Spyradosoma sp.]
MDTVIITGAAGEPALSIARRLCGLGIRVYALAGTIPENGLGADEFVPVPCDLTSPEAVVAAVESIFAKENHVVGVVLAGQYLSDEPFEAVPPEEIPLAFNAQVVSPLCVVRRVLPSLIASRGHVVVVSPGAGTSAGRALNAAADAATRAFAGTLFAELRDTGVKTCHILLQGNEGAPDPAARFTTTPQSRIHADVVADAVETVFRLRENNALTQMILRPQATRETPRIPVSSEPKIRALQVVQLPPAKNFPPEEEPIPTPAYRRPDYAPKKTELPAAERDDEDDGFSDDYVDPELRYLLKNEPQKNRGGNAGGENSGGEPRGNERRRRKRNRKNRNRNRSADGAIRVNAPRLGDAQPDAEPRRDGEGSGPNPHREETAGAPVSSDAPAEPERAAENPPPPPSSPETPSVPAESPARAPETSVPAPAAREDVPAAESAPDAPAGEKKSAAKRPRKPRAPRRPKPRPAEDGNGEAGTKESSEA